MATVPGGAGGLALFNDAHSFLHGVSDEVEAVKQLIATEDEKRRVEIEELRKDQEQERFERRDSLNKLRYEFESFVRRKIDKVIEEIGEMKKSARRDDNTQQQQINTLIADFDRIKDNLFNVQSSWGKLVSNCVTPQQQERYLATQQEEQNKIDSPKASPRATPRARSYLSG